MTRTALPGLPKPVARQPSPASLPMVLSHVTALSVERITPSFVRVELGSPALAHFGVDGPLFDQRIKLIFPPQGGALPDISGADETWLSCWFAQPVERRGSMRTYTVREVRGSGENITLVIDFVLHEAPGETGPGSSWASRAVPGDRITLLGPRRGHAFGGIEFRPGAARKLLLVGDETAVPAIAGILAGLADTTCGTAFLEVPVTGDVMQLPAPEGVDVRWLPRNGCARGTRQIAAVRAHLGLPPAVVTIEDRSDSTAAADLWETPTFSSSGEVIGETAPAQGDPADLYAWIAGESGVVTRLRRCLVAEHGMPRAQIAFMGYWRRGVAMRS
jgi:NADPH-dependent ferric siderophore reductase